MLLYTYAYNNEAKYDFIFIRIDFLSLFIRVYIFSDANVSRGREKFYYISLKVGLVLNRANVIRN